MLTLPPTKEQIIAQSVCEQITKLRRSSIGGDEVAREAVARIIARLRETKDAKLVDTIELELNKCQKKLLA